MRAYFFWEAGRDLRFGTRSNQYGALLARSLRRHGIHLEPGDYAFGADWLERSRPEYSVLHLNWLDRFYTQEGPDGALAQYTRFAEALITPSGWATASSGPCITCSRTSGHTPSWTGWSTCWWRARRTP